ncbi:hypothetical protein Hanom_Chr15g01370221 [Helianthus anomalus]
MDSKRKIIYNPPININNLHSPPSFTFLIQYPTRNPYVSIHTVNLHLTEQYHESKHDKTHLLALT